MLTSSTIHIVGACPFGGVILLSSTVYGIQGTFCNDGNFVLPLKKKIYLKNVLIIEYSMNHDIGFEYTSTQPTSPAVLTMTQHEEFTFQLYTDDWIPYTCYYGLQDNPEGDVGTDERECLFVFFYYTYYRPHPDVISLESMTGYVVTVIEHASGKCLTEQTNTTVVIEYRDGHNMSSNRCAGMLGDYSDNIKQIKIFLWFTDFVSVFSFSEMDYWLFNVTIKAHIQSKNDVGATYKGPSQYYIMGYSGSFLMEDPSTTVIISLEKLPAYMYDILVTGTGTELEDSLFGVSLIIDTDLTQVELFYITTKLSLTMMIHQRTQHKKKSFHIYNSAWFRLEYKKRILSKYHHIQYNSWCEYNSYTQQNSLICNKSIKLAASLTSEKLLWEPRTFIGSYDVNQHKFVHAETSMNIIESHMGPVEISANGAAEACRQTGTKLLQTQIFGFWMTGFQTINASNFSRYACVYWHINFTSQQRLDNKQIDINCKNIASLFKLQYYRYSSRDMSSSPTYFIHSYSLNEWLLRMNKDLFCSGSNVTDPQQHYCSVLVPNYYAITYSLLYVPCDLKLPHSGYVCEEREVQEKLTPVLKTLSAKAWGNFSKKEQKSMERHHYTKLLNDAYNRYSTSSIYPLLFECVDKTFLPNYYICDGHSDCPGGTDEANCTDICSYHQSRQEECFNSCQIPHCRCSDLYFQCESGG